MPGDGTEREVSIDVDGQLMTELAKRESFLPSARTLSSINHLQYSVWHDGCGLLDPGLDSGGGS